MTREESIKILDPETTAEALAEIEYYSGFSGQMAKIQAVNAACEIAVADMREQAERSNGCDRCSLISEKDGWKSPAEMLKNNLGAVFCYKCGRKL